MPPRRPRKSTPSDTTAGLARAIALLERFSQRVAVTFGRMASIANVVSAAYARISSASAKIAASLRSSVESLRQISSIMASQQRSTGGKVATGAAVGAAEGAAAFAASQGLTQAFTRVTGQAAATATATAATTAALSSAAAPAAATASSFSALATSSAAVTSAVGAAVPYVAAIAAIGATIYAGWKLLEPIWPAISAALSAAAAALRSVMNLTLALVNPLTYVRAGWNLAVKSAHLLRDASYAVASAVRSAVVGAVNAAIAAWRQLSGIAVATTQRIASGFQSLGRGATAVGGALQRGLSLAGSALTDLLEKLTYAGVAVAGLGAAIVGPLTDAANKFGEAGTDLGKFADESGLTARQVSELGYAAEVSGGSVSGFAAGVAKSAELLADAIDGGKKAGEAFRRLGVDADSLDGATREEQFYAIAQAVASIADPFDRAAAAQEFFGSAGESVVKMLEGGLGGLANLRGEAERLGRVMDGDAVSAATALTQSYAQLKAGLQGLWQTIGQAVAPLITGWNKILVGAVQGAIAWTKANQPLIATVFRVAEGAVTIGTAVAAATAGIVPLLPKILLAAGAAAAGAVAWVKYGRSVEAATAPFRAGLAKLWDEASRVFGGITNAVRAGNLELAVQVLWSGAQVAWSKGLTAIASLTGEGLGGILKAFAAGDWKSAGGQAWNQVQIAFEQGMGKLDQLWTGLQSMVDKVVTYIRQAWNTAIQEIGVQLDKLLATAIKVFDALNGYDPTGAAKVVRDSLAAAQNRTGFTPSADANAKLQEDLDKREQARKDQASKRQAERDERIAKLRGEVAKRGDAAGAAAQAKIAALEKRLNEQIAAAEAARAAAEAKVKDPFAQDRKLLEGGKKEITTGLNGTATFSATAASLLGPRSAMDRIAKATEQTAKNTQPKEQRVGRHDPVFMP